jgi:hypothetical protein
MNQENPKTTELTEAPPTLPSVAVQEAAADAEVFATASRAASTWRAYESDWRIFIAWCQTMDLAALPAAPATKFSSGEKYFCQYFIACQPLKTSKLNLKRPPCPARRQLWHRWSRESVPRGEMARVSRQKRPGNSLQRSRRGPVCRIDSPAFRRSPATGAGAIAPRFLRPPPPL